MKLIRVGGVRLNLEQIAYYGMDEEYLRIKFTGGNDLLINSDKSEVIVKFLDQYVVNHKEF